MLKKKIEEYVATGRRKTSVASVRLRPGSGQIKINGNSFEKYVPDKIFQDIILAPLVKLELGGKYDLIIRMQGGGCRGQVDAARLALARALVLEDESRRGVMKEDGFLRRDPRKKERKKFGLKKARKSSQFSKR